MIDQKEVPTSVEAQYLTAKKYAKTKLEVPVKDGVNCPNIEDDDNDKETNEKNDCMDSWKSSH